MELDRVQDTVFLEDSSLAPETAVLLPPIRLENIVSRENDMIFGDFGSIGQARRSVMETDGQATSRVLFNLRLPLHDGDGGCNNNVGLDIRIRHEEGDSLNGLAHSHFYGPLVRFPSTVERNLPSANMPPLKQVCSWALNQCNPSRWNGKSVKVRPSGCWASTFSILGSWSSSSQMVLSSGCLEYSRSLSRSDYFRQQSSE